MSIYKHTGHTTREHGKPEWNAISRRLSVRKQEEKASEGFPGKIAWTRRTGGQTCGLEIVFWGKFCAERAGSGAAPFAPALAEHTTTCKRVTGCGLMQYEFPWLCVDELTESVTSSGWMVKEEEGRSVLWLVHVLAQSCRGQGKENGCGRKSESGVWGEKKPAKAWPAINITTGCSYLLGKVVLTSAECVPTPLGHHPLLHPFLCQVLPGCPRQPHTIQGEVLLQAKPWSAGPYPAASVTEAPLWAAG